MSTEQNYPADLLKAVQRYDFSPLVFCMAEMWSERVKNADSTERHLYSTSIAIHREAASQPDNGWAVGRKVILALCDLLEEIVSEQRNTESAHCGLEEQRRGTA